MKQLYCIVIISWTVLLCACSQNEDFYSQTPGYLSISEISLTCDGEGSPFTKAVDEVLQLEIWQNGTVVPGQSYTAGNAPERIALSPGTYILKAFSSGYNKEATTGVKGTPAYYNEYPFTIATSDNIIIKLSVPMQNIGVKFAPSEEFGKMFPSFNIKVETSSRSYTFDQTNYMEAAYFNIPENGSLSYTITAKNTDNELVGPLQKSINVKYGTIYTLALKIE